MDFTELLEEVNNPKGLKCSQWEPGQSALTNVSSLSTVLSLKISKETRLLLTVQQHFSARHQLETCFGNFDFIKIIIISFIPFPLSASQLNLLIVCQGQGNLGESLMRPAEKQRKRKAKPGIVRKKKESNKRGTKCAQQTTLFRDENGYIQEKEVHT